MGEEEKEDDDNDDGDDEEEEEIREDDEDEYDDTKLNHDRFLEAMYNTEGFNVRCHVVETGEWTEEFSEKFELAYEKTKEYDKYEWFDTDNNKRCIGISDVMKDTYHVVTEWYKNKGLVQNNGWIENSDGILLTDDWEDAFKERFHVIYLELGGIADYYDDIYGIDEDDDDDDDDDNKLKIRTRKEYQQQDSNVPNNLIRVTNTTQEGGWVRFLKTGKDKCSRLIRKAQDTMNKN